MKNLSPDHKAFALDDHQLDAFLRMAVPVVVVDLENLTCVMVNDEAVRVYGYSAAEFKKLRLFDLNLKIPVGALKFGSEFSNTHTITLNHLVHKLKDGGTRDVNAIITRYQYQGRDVMVGILGDASPRSSADEQVLDPTPILRTCSRNCVFRC